MEYYTIIYRTLFIYLILLGIFRMMGKREIGQLSVLDFIVFIMIAEMAVISIENPEEPMLKHLTGIFVMFVIQIIFSLLSLWSKKFRELADGKPTILIEKGKVNDYEMKMSRYNFDDLLSQLRENNVKSIADVEFGILETTGKLSVITKEESSPPKQKNAASLVFPVVLDGNIQEEHLTKLGFTPLWLRQQLKKIGVTDLKSIAICTVDGNGSLYVDQKDKK
ncbi:hypothetical protein A374_11240 [Fictibacillus macauensis ZFHKF-1]|uniref:YetF C-terminal domain-containing protein n=1 Tax=Fictibacillus macauensis ZFHKF-1 TaxID=1196324 RepID=I8AIL1_9BACL|nr:DUF421 domain-containing protein [Fictibacillus macauensis]EIT85314.1 hypothetical protein A374_11240 [Fictibacillus macauensis ZFHKF-1]